MKPKAFYIGVIFFIIVVSSSFAQQDEKVQRWRTDIDFIVQQIESFHPHPWHRLTKEVFLNDVNRLKTEIPDLSEEEIIVRAMQLVASLCDGHTSLCPYNHPLIPIWFPLRMEIFDEGVFITSIDKECEEFIGAKVLRIGKLTAEECFELVGSITSVDSPVGFQRTVPVYISNPGGKAPRPEE